MQDKYVGADVHPSTTTFVVHDASGRLMMEATVETKAKSLIAFVTAIPGKVHFTFEEGTQAAWLYDLLRPYVAELIVCDPRANRLLAGNKSDAIDAAKLAQLLRGGFLNAVYHGEHGTRHLKDLAYGYQTLMSESVRLKNKIKAVYRSHGIPTPGGDVYEEEVRESWLAKLPRTGLTRRAAWYLDALDGLMKLRKEAEAAMLEEAKRHRACKLLGTVPGIGVIRSALLVAIVDTPHRFRTKRQLWSYAGLGVVTRSSSDYVIGAGELRRKRKPATRGLNRNHNPMLKSVFVGAAVDAMTHGRLKEYAGKFLAAGARPEMLRLTIARKLAAISLAVWKKGEPYNPKKALTQGS